jgi:uncharacterized protein YcfJ
MSDPGDDSQPSWRDIENAIVSIRKALDKEKDRVLERWNDTSLIVKLFFWVPAQAVLFKIQPFLWTGLKRLLLGTGSVVGAVAGGVTSLRFQTQLVLVLTGLFTVQTTVLLLKFNRYDLVTSRVVENTEELLVRTDDILWIVEDVESEVSDLCFDGGHDMPAETNDQRSRDVETTGTGALGGAVAGGAFGASVGGPAGAIGGALLGLILGDEAEKGSIKQERREAIKLRILKLLVRNQSWKEAFTEDQIIARFRDTNEELVRKSIEEMVRDRSIPIERDEDDSQLIHLTSPSEARSYIRNAEMD